MFASLLAATLVAFAHAQMIIKGPPNNIFVNRATYCTPFTFILGPQPGDGPPAAPRTAAMITYSGNPCTSDSIDVDVNGKVVILPYYDGGLCAASNVYFAMNSKNATAVVQIMNYGVGSTPGWFYYVYYGNEEALKTRQGNMLFLTCAEMESTVPSGYNQLFSDYTNACTACNLTVTISPQISPYYDAYHSWWWSMFLRWIPGFGFLITAVISAIFLGLHIELVVKKYITRVSSEDARTWGRHLANLWNSRSLPHLTLFIESVTSLCLMMFTFMYGWYMVPNPYATQYFVTALAGFGFSCDVLSAKFWSSMYHQLPSHEKEPNRGVAWMLNHHIIGPVLMIVPLALDTWVSIQYARRETDQVFNVLTVLLLIFLQLVVGVHFMRQSHAFLKEVADVMKALKAANKAASKTASKISTRGGDTAAIAPARIEQSNSREVFLARMTKWQFRLGACMGIYVLINFMGSIGPARTAAVPTGTYFIVVVNIRWASSICRVMMNRPRIVGGRNLRTYFLDTIFRRGDDGTTVGKSGTVGAGDNAASVASRMGPTGAGQKSSMPDKSSMRDHPTNQLAEPNAAESSL